MDVDAVIDERFGKWTVYFRKERVTPVLVVGVNARRRELVFTTCTGLDQSEMRAMLVEAISLIDSGKIEFERPEAARGLDT